MRDTMRRRASGSDTMEGSHRKERKNFTTEQKTILMKYITDNMEHCYPNATEKMTLADDANLTIAQVSDYMINARRRILPPMLKEAGKDHNLYKKRRQHRRESKEGPAAKRRKANSCPVAVQSVMDDVQESSVHSLSSATGRDENEEVFLPVVSNKVMSSVEKEQLQRLIPPYPPGEDSMYNTEEYHRQDSVPLSSTNSTSSSPSPNCGLSSSPHHSDSEDSFFRRSTKEESVFQRSTKEMEIAIILANFGSLCRSAEKAV